MTDISPSLPPYAKALDIDFAGADAEQPYGQAPTLTFPFGIKVQGRPGFLHGGAISGLLEMAAVVAIHDALIKQGSDAPIKQANVTIDFMRAGQPQISFAQGKVTRLGRTMANVTAYAWQDDPERIIAQGHMHYLIGRSKEA